jgi:hypothetical protein
MSLSIFDDCTDKERTSLYRKLMLICHPDKNGDKETATFLTKCITSEYQIYNCDDGSETNGRVCKECEKKELFIEKLSGEYEKGILIYNELVDEYNRIVQKYDKGRIIYNELVDEYNDTVQKYERGKQIYGELVDAYNDVVHKMSNRRSSYLHNGVAYQYRYNNRTWRYKSYGFRGF